MLKLSVKGLALAMGLLIVGNGYTAENKEIDAAKLYEANCAICHGDKGDANTRASGSLRPPPRNFTTIQAALELSRERMITSVSEGRPGTGMMPHKDRFSSEEIAAIVDFIRSEFMRTPEEAKKIKNVEGGQIYAKNCSVCHGDKGQGAVWARSQLNPAPRNFTSKQAREELSRERMIASVTHGRPGTAMQPHNKRLTAKQIEQVVDYVREAFMSDVATQTQTAGISGQLSPQLGGAGPLGAGNSQMPRDRMHAPLARQQQLPRDAMHGAGNSKMPRDAMHGAAKSKNPHAGPHAGAMPGVAQVTPEALPPARAADMSVPLPGGLKADLAWGEDFYMKNCFSCHGVTGEGNGPRAYFNTPRPRNFTSAMSRRMLNRERIYNSITNGRVGTVMPAWGKVLSEQQIASLTEFVFQNFIVPGLGNKPETGGKKKAN